MKELAVLNKYFLKYKWRFLWGILFVSLSNYFRVLQPQMIRQALDLVVENIGLFDLSQGFNIQKTLTQDIGKILLFFGIVVLVLALIMGVFMYFMRQTIIVMSRLIEHDMREELFAKYTELDLAFYKKNNTGDLMSRITEDVSKVRMYLGPGILYGINLVSLFILVIYSMLSVSPTLTLYTLLPTPFLSISIYYVSNLINKRSTIIQEQLATLNSNAQEVYSGIRVVKSYVQEKAMLGFFKEQSDDYKEKTMDLARVNALFFPLMVLLVGASTVLTVYIGGIQVAKGTVTPGNIAEFVIYVNMLTWPITALGWIASIMQQASASQKRINQFLSTPSSISFPDVKPKPIKGDIKFENVSFVYPDSGIRALKKLSFEVKAGQKLAIIGKTGSGKTTIADLLVRMYDVNDGKIFIDGQDIRTFNLANLRQRVAYVPQDVFLFSDTIAGNIAFGKRDASMGEIEKFAAYAAVHKDIVELPKAYQTKVGERGVTLSGGQKQRISIARALIKNPDIVILDDSLSAVDTGTEQQIVSYLNGELKDKTSIIITHRIYSSLKFDHIIVLEDGHIVEQGDHDHLIQQGGYYAQVFEQQQLEEDISS